MTIAKRQQWAMFCLAVWLTGTVISAVVATENFFTIDRLLANSISEPFRQAMEKLGPAPAGRNLLYYFSGELNRLYFQYWNVIQLPVGVLALWLVRPLPNARRALWGIVAMLSVVVFLTVALTPPIITIGRSLDFVPRIPPPPGLRTFGLLHAAFSVFTMINLILGGLVTLWIQRTGDEERATARVEKRAFWYSSS